MALPDLGNTPPDVREAVTDPRWTLGSISGGATTSRKPAKRQPGEATACGVRLNNGGGHRGAAARRPVVRCRRAEDGTPPERREKRAPAAVFVPGETQEVPVLEKPPVIGVVEDFDGPNRASTIPTHTLSTSSANPSEAR